MPNEPDRNPIGPALGRIPSGLYILTVGRGPASTGILASWVQQAGFDPPAVTVAVAHGRFVADWIAETGGFTLNQLPVGSKPLLRHFAKGFEPDAPAFDGVNLTDEFPETAGPVLADALAFLDLRVAGSVDSGDHRIYVGRVVAASVLNTGAEPFVHVRGNGLHY